MLLSVRRLHVSFVFYNHEVEIFLNVDAELFRIRLGNALEFKELVGVSDISAAFSCPHLWLTYIIISSGISLLGYHFRPWSMLWSPFLYLFSFKKVERERIREFTVHLTFYWLNYEQHKCDHYLSDLVHVRNWTIDLVSFKSSSLF